jgi:hypothetical protein
MTDFELHELDEALMSGRMRWGNYSYLYERLMNQKLSSTERERLQKEKANLNLALRKRANMEKKRAKHFNNRKGTLKRIAKLCKWECQGEKCWAHNSKMCPYIHKNNNKANRTRKN